MPTAARHQSSSPDGELVEGRQGHVARRSGPRQARDRAAEATVLEGLAARAASSIMGSPGWCR